MPISTSTRQAVGQGQAAVEFDPVPAGKLFVGIVLLPVKFAGAELRHRNSFLSRLGHGRQADGDVGFFKGRNGVLVWRAGIRVGIVRFAADQMQPDGIRAGRADDGFFGDGDLWSAGSADVGVKDIFPDRRAGSAGNVFHVEHVVLEVFVKNVRLDLKRNLRGSQFVLQARQGGGGAGFDDHRIDQRQHPGGNAKNRNDFQEFAHAYAGGAHRRDFTIGSHAAEAQQNADQHSHGDGDFQCRGQGEKENFRYAGKRSAVAHHGFKNARKFAHKNDKREH